MKEVWGSSGYSSGCMKKESGIRANGVRMPLCIPMVSKVL
jgi:hypothetical protein